MASSRPKALNFITGNKNKLAEVKAILGDVAELQSKALDMVEIQGTSDEIAKDKCRRAAEAARVIHTLMPDGGSDHSKVNGPVLTEDTALEFHALKGLPGPYM